MHRRDFLHGVLALPGVASLGNGIGPSFGTTVPTGEELKAALAAATPGSEILLAPGDFGDVAQFDLTVPDVTIRASVPQRSIIRSPLEITGDRATIADLAFRGEGENNLYMVAIAACKNRLRSRRVGSKSEAVTLGIFPAVRSSLVKARSGSISTIADSTTTLTARLSIRMHMKQLR